jgi:hypothetical protein
MRIQFLAALAATAALLPAPALAWGKTGHRVVAAIADTQLSGLARAHVEQILGPGEGLDEAATWPDDMRADPSPLWQKQASPWHYVTMNGVTYDHAPPEGDALEALGRFARTLQDPNASRADKQMALRFVVHLVGDVHQPLHAGKCCDHGANEVKVTWFGKPTNLHAVWDSSIVDEEQLSFTELAAKLERHITPADIIAWSDVNPLDWVTESARLRDSLYPTKTDMPKPVKGKKRRKGPPPLPDLSFSYVYRFTPLMEQRLSQGGVRLAAYLNAVFATPRPVTSQTNPK